MSVLGTILVVLGLAAVAGVGFLVLWLYAKGMSR